MIRDSSMRRHSSLPTASTTQTSGAVLADGRIIDLISDIATRRLKLISFDGTQYQIADRIEIGKRTIVPLALDAAIQGAIALPTRASDYGTTEGLFAEIREVLTAHGMSQEVASTGAYFEFASWFQDLHFPAPCLIITGPGAEATIFLQLLACFVRRGLLMHEVDSHGFRGLIDNVHPTLLIDARSFTPRSLHKLTASCGPRAYVPWKGSVANFSFARAIYLGVRPAPDFSADFSLHVHITPSRRGLSLLDEKEREQIIAAFQPRFLDYRFRNIDRIRASAFELPESDSEGVIIGRMLGGCIVDAPEIQAGVRPLLEGREAQLRAGRWTDLTCIIVEALLDRCHGPTSDRIHVGEIAEVARVILKARGGPAEFEARSVGPILRRLGFDTTPRDAHGFYIRFTTEIHRAIHRLARDHRVAAVEGNIEQCALCTETFKAGRGATDPGTDVEK